MTAAVVVSCQVVTAADVAKGDVMWLAGDGAFQVVEAVNPLSAGAVSIVLRNGLCAPRFGHDPALIQARRRA